MCCSPDLFSFLTRRLAHTLVDRFGLIDGEYTHIHIHGSRTNECVCARFNIDVIKSQLDLIQQASPYPQRLVSFLLSFFLSSLSLSPRSFLRFVDAYLLFSDTFSRFSLVVIEPHTRY